MGVVGAQLKVQAVLALGDNFYYSGIATDATSPRFAQTWDNVYTDTSLQVPWYVIAGNYDYKGNVTAQVAYSGVSSRWTFPALYHSQSFVFAEDGTTVDVVLIDTVNLSGESTASTASSAHGAESDLYFAPLPLLEKEVAQQQCDWIEAQLAASTADYLIVAGNYTLLFMNLFIHLFVPLYILLFFYIPTRFIPIHLYLYTYSSLNPPITHRPLPRVLPLQPWQHPHPAIAPAPPAEEVRRPLSVGSRPLPGIHAV
jgi:hypothetical protein